MSNLVRKMMVRVIHKRMAAGESFTEIIADYPKLTEAEIAELKKAVLQVDE